MIKIKNRFNYEDFPSSIQELTFTEAQKFYSEKKLDIKKELEHFDRVKNEKGEYTNLALILSDQNPFDIKFAEFSDPDMVNIISRKEFTGSVLKQFQEILEFFELTTNDSNISTILKQNNKYEFPKKAIREAVVNSIVHRNYKMYGPVLIKVNKKNFRVTSLSGTENYFEFKDLISGFSFQRNPKLVEIFYNLKLMEASGKGLNKIYSEYDDEEAKPEIYLSQGVFDLKLPNKFKEAF